MGPRDDGTAALSARAPLALGGVLLSIPGDAGDTWAFIPSDVALRLSALSSLTDVPGVRPPGRGIALAEGEVVTVIEVGALSRAAPSAPESDDAWPVPGADRAVLCAVGAQTIALIGGRVLSTGVFDRAPGEHGVLFRGRVVRTLDVRALYAQAETAIWAERATPSALPPPPVSPPNERSR